MVEPRVDDGVLALRLQQQAAVAELGQRALSTPDLDEFLHDASVLIAEQLDVEFVKVLERLPGGDDFLLRAGLGWHPGAVGEAIVPGGRESQAGFVIASGGPVIVQDIASETRFRNAQLLLDHGVTSGIGVPIRGPRKPYGVVGAHSARRRPFGPDDATFLQAVANVLGAAIQLRLNARAQELLAEAGELLNGSLDYAETLRSLARLIVPRMGDWCAVHLVDRDGAVRELEIAHRDPRLASAVQHLRESYGTAPVDDRVAAALRTGRPVVFSRITPRSLAAEIGDPAQREMLEELGTTSAMLLPVVARGRTLGVMQVVSSRPQRRYGYDDVTLALELAARAALAIDNARLYRVAQQTAGMREAFLSSVSHELRTPLTSVLGFTQRLARRAARFDPETRGDIETLDVEARRMHAALDTLLNLADLESGRVRVALEPVELRRLLNDEIGALERRAPAVRVERDFPDAPCISLTDPDRVRQIVGNLLDNAAKHGGDPAEITVALRHGEGRTEIGVRDRGSGLPPGLRAHVFDRFVRGRSSGAHGMGLGLYLSRLVADRLHAELSVRDAPGGGAEFLLRLPLDRAAPLSEDE
jgi:signal transduction histidine kinase